MGLDDTLSPKPLFKEPLIMFELDQIVGNISFVDVKCSGRL